MGEQATTASDTPSNVVEREVLVEPAPASVWRWWTEPERIVRWMGSAAEVDLTPGGSYRISYANGAVMRGEILELDPPRRLLMTWGWEDPAEAVGPGGSRVEVTFEPEGDATRVRVRHSGLPVDERPGHDEGWIYFLGRLDAAVAAA
jgi:uncharacterized protein YndB with AHSA1/START domain